MPTFLSFLNRCETWLVEYWSSKRCDADPPPRRAIDPLEMWQFLPHLQIHALTDDDRLLCRLSGTAVVSATHFDQTGSYLDEVIAADAYGRRKQQFDRCMQIGRPVVYRARIALPRGHGRTYRRLMLPLCYRSPHADMVLSHLVFERADAAMPFEASALRDILEYHEMAPDELAGLDPILPPPPLPTRQACYC